MSTSFVVSSLLPRFDLWRKMEASHAPVGFDLEITARCNNDCRHCYINLSAGDRQAAAQELSLTEIQEIGRQAVSLGTVWCLITGGEPLLREDFSEIYLALKRQGLLVSVFTNATLITEEHVRLFRRYPPRDLEVTVYGVSRETYERVTRRPGSFAAFQRGVELLLGGGVPVRFKAMVLRSNVHELAAIAEFCQTRTKDRFRFDPMLHMRYDGDENRNAEIRAERLDPEEIASIERSDGLRMQALRDNCNLMIQPQLSNTVDDHLFSCGAGGDSFSVGFDGRFRPCMSLWHPDTVYDLRKGSVRDAWRHLVPRVRDMRSQCPEFLSKCRRCPIINLCLWCPAHAYLETGKMDAWSSYFCRVANARAHNLVESGDESAVSGAIRTE